MVAPFLRFALRAGLVPSTRPLATPLPDTRFTVLRQPALPSFTLASAGRRLRTFGTTHCRGTSTFSATVVLLAALRPVAVQVRRSPRSLRDTLYVDFVRARTVF